MSDAAIEVVDVVKTYEDGHIKALNGADLTVAKGELIAVTGPSGCGKSTLLHLIAALDAPDSGTIVVNGQDLGEVDDLSAYRARQIGLVFQLHNLLPTLTAAENVQVPMFELYRAAGERRSRSLELLDAVGIADKAQMRPAELSGGERQRVAIARALANDPPIVLADEPTGSLDSKTGGRMMDLLEQIRDQRHVTIVVVTHNPQLAERVDRVVPMLDGRIVVAAAAA